MLFNKKYYDEGAEGGTGTSDQLKDLNFDNTGVAKLPDGKIVIKDQDTLNKINANNRRNLQEQNQKLIDDLNKIKENYKMSDDQRQELESRIENLQNEFMTKEQLAEQQLKKKENELSKLVEQHKQSSEQWQGRYSQTTIRNNLIEAAIANKAVSADQIYDILVSKTKIKEELKDGQPTGNYIPVVSLTDTDEDGKSVMLELSPSEAVKRMSEQTNKYGNLFVSSATGGTGTLSNQTGNAPNNSYEKLQDTDAYMEFRKKGGNPSQIKFE